MLALSDSEIHLWFAFPGETGDPQKPASAGSVLDDGEEARMKRLHFPDGRHLFGASHTLVRTALSCYGAIPPDAWRFVENAHGKPRIDPDFDSSPLSFSLSHTKGLAVVAVTGGADVGVDVERADRVVNAARLSSRFFSPEEAAALQELSPERLRELFFLYWTLKESYIKARGLGLSLPLDSFSFRLAGEIPFQIGFSGNDPDGPGGWRFVLLRPMPQYVAAAGVSFARPDPVRIRCFQALPSGEFSPLSFEPVGLSPGVEITDHAFLEM
ncbi:MAG: 4'-phosphopantetheinyl transferase superfamily protein [Deltaproteobacteria bacterium]|nr:4'-phosphopantetheinyl transferase superfamily protein [Deltaproteobacteria bacterium]